MSNMVVQTNILALNAHRNLKGVGATQSRASQRLSSGYRINSAADDAAGLAISEKMRSQIRGLDMASKNAQDAISLIQTAEGGMQEVNNMVQRIRELIVYASNDTQEANSSGTSDRQKIQDEINQLTQEIDKTADRVEFNKKKLLNGSYEAVAKDDTVVGAYVDAQAALRIAQTNLAKAANEYDKAAQGVQSARDAFANILADTAANAALKVLAGKKNVGGIYDALMELQARLPFLKTTAQMTMVSGLGSMVTRVTSAVQKAANSLMSGAISFAGWTSEERTQWAAISAVFADGKAITKIAEALRDAYDNLDTKAGDLTDATESLGEAQGDVAETKALYDTADKTSGLYFQLGPNSAQGMSLSISSVKTNKLGIGQGNGISLINVLPQSGSEITAQLDTMDVALTYVTTERGKMGAAQNRLEYSIKSLDVTSENLTASESRVRDADMAKEMMTVTKANVLQQAAVSMLAQANQTPQNILQLLK